MSVLLAYYTTDYTMIKAVTHLKCSSVRYVRATVDHAYQAFTNRGREAEKPSQAGTGFGRCSSSKQTALGHHEVAHAPREVNLHTSKMGNSRNISSYCL